MSALCSLVRRREISKYNSFPQRIQNKTEKNFFQRVGREESLQRNEHSSNISPLQLRIYLEKKKKKLLGAGAAAAKSLQLCPTLGDPIDGSPPGSPIPGILQARILEWVAISFSNA